MIYTKLEEGKRHLYITAEGTDVPSADDIELTYKDEAGTEIEDIDDYKFFYNVGFKYQQIRGSKERDTITEEDENIYVYAGDELIIGHIGGEGGEDNAIVGTAIVGKAKVGVA